MRLRKYCRSVTFAVAVVSTVIDRLIQDRPPLPEEPEISNTRVSQAPIKLGVEIATTGTTAVLDTDIFLVISGEALGQLVVAQGLPWHSAFRTTEGVRDTADPTTAQSVEPLMYALMCLLLAHTHVDVLAQAKRSTEPHGNCVATPPLSVFESNSTVI